MKFRTSASVQWPFLLALGMVILPATHARADAVWIRSGKGNSVALDKVKITGVENGSLVFTTQSGNQTSKPLATIPRMRLDDEPAFNEAETAFDNADWPAAADGYRKAIAVSTKDWLKDRASLRLLEAANKSGNFAAAVAGYVELLQKKPDLAAQAKPAIPKEQPAAIDTALGEVKQASQSPQLKPEQKTALLNYLVELYTAKGDTTSASAVMQQLGKTAPAELQSSEMRKNEATLTLEQAKQAVASKQYPQAIQLLTTKGGALTDPVQQADGLYLLAEARAGTAATPDQWKDAAITYMRVAANFKSVEGKPHVADAMLKTAQIEEKLKNPKEALALYQQVASEFKGSPAAAQAKQDAARLSAAAKG